LIASSVEAFIAQRLVRVICQECKIEDKRQNTEDKKYIDMPKGTKIYYGKGCDKCKHTGYKGRTAISETLILSAPIKDLIMKKVSSDEIRNKAVSLGMRTLRDEGWEKIKAGITTIDEVMRVTQINQ